MYNLCLNEEKETLESDANNHRNNFCLQTNDDEQQQPEAAAAAEVQGSIYEYILVRREAACSKKI